MKKVIIGSIFVFAFVVIVCYLWTTDQKLNPQNLLINTNPIKIILNDIIQEKIKYSPVPNSPGVFLFKKDFKASNLVESFPAIKQNSELTISATKFTKGAKQIVTGYESEEKLTIDLDKKADTLRSHRVGENTISCEGTACNFGQTEIVIANKFGNNIYTIKDNYFPPAGAMMKYYTTVIEKKDSRIILEIIYSYYDPVLPEDINVWIQKELRPVLYSSSGYPKQFISELEKILI